MSVTKPTRAKPPTVTERRLIKKYGSLVAARKAQKAQIVERKIREIPISPKITPVKQVDYQRAWNDAQTHWSKGMAGAYLYHMARETNPQTMAVYAYVKELDKQTRAGNISPGRATGSLLAQEQIKMSMMPVLDKSTVVEGKISYDPKFDTYYTRDKTGKLIVTSGERGRTYFEESIARGSFERPKQIRVPIAEPIVIPPVVSPTKEMYVPELGGFIQSDVRGQFLDVTPKVRYPTPEERIQLEKTTGQKFKDIKDVVVTQIRKPRDLPGVRPTPSMPFETYGVPTKPDVTDLDKIDIFNFLGSPGVSKRGLSLPFDISGVPSKPDVTAVRRFTSEDIMGMFGLPSISKRDVGLPFETYGVPSRPGGSGVRRFTAEEIAGGFGFPDVSKGKVGLPFDIFGVPTKPDVTDLDKIDVSKYLKKPGVAKRDIGLPFETFGVPEKVEIKKIELGQYIQEATGITDIKQIRQLNIEAKKRGDKSFQFMSRRGIETVPTAKTWFGASLNVAELGAEVAALESGVAEKRWKLRQHLFREPSVSDMADILPIREPTQEEIAKEAKDIGVLTRGSIEFGLMDVPAFAGGTFVLTKAAGTLTKSGRAAKSYKKYKKFLGDPKSKVVDMERKFKPITEKKTIKGLEKKLRLEKQKLFLKIKQKKTGEVIIKRPEPTGTFTGTVREKLFTKNELGSGTVKLVNGEYVETVNFMKSGIKRVTTRTKDGKGVVKLYKNGKKVAEFQLKKGVSPALKFKEIAKKQKMQQALGTPETQETLRTRGSKMVQFREAPKRELTTGLERAEKREILRFGRDIKGGIGERVEQIESVFDITRVSPEIRVTALKKGKKAVTKKIRKGRKVEEGKGRPQVREGYVGFAEVEGEKRLTKLITPKIDRKIEQEVRQRIVTTFGEATPRKIPKIKRKPVPFKPVKEIPIKPVKDVKTRVEEIGGKTKQLLIKTKEKAKEVLYVEKPQEFLRPLRLKTPRIPIVSKISKPPVSVPSITARTALSTAPVLAMKVTPLLDIKSDIGLKEKVGVGVGVDVGITGESIAQGLESEPLVGMKPGVTTPLFAPALQVPRPTTPVTIPKVPEVMRPTKPKVPKAPSLLFGFDRKPSPKVVKAQGYSASVLRAGPTGKKQWVKLDMPPATRESALSAGARETDEEIGARFKIDKVAKKVQAVQRVTGKLQTAFAKRVQPKVGVIDTKDKYFRDKQKKFRMWKQKKGKRKATPNQFIERQPYRLDSQQEKRSIQRAKRATPKKPTKKRNKMFRL